MLAALDLGTNNCRLLIARPSRRRDGFRVVDAFSRIVRLGEGVAEDGALSEQAMKRTLEALRICASKIRGRGVSHARCVATEACRRAANRGEFLDRIRRRTGLEIEIISTREEARLALAGCSPLLDPGRSNAIVFDIGGGSTEVSWLRARLGEPPRILDWISAPVGVVTLTERFGGDRIGRDLFNRMAEEVAAMLRPFENRHRIARAISEGRVQMLGTSGTVTTLAGVHMRLPRYSRDKVDGTTLSFPDVEEISLRLADLDFAGRASYPCIGRERADLVVSGCAILEAIRRLWPVERLSVADRGVREGILVGMMRDLKDDGARGGGTGKRRGTRPR